MLTAALERAGLARIRLAAVANDTVAALILQSYQARGRDAGAGPAAIGLILGTGTNLAADLGPAGIRNLESGNFDGVAAVETPYDAALDRELDEPPPGAQRFEKMVSGHYLGEILRRALVDLGRGPGGFHWSAAPALATPFGLDSAHLSRIAADRTAGLDDVGALLRSLGVESTPAERHGVRALGAAIARRAARLVAAGAARHAALPRPAARRSAYHRSGREPLGRLPGLRGPRARRPWPSWSARTAPDASRSRS